MSLHDSRVEPAKFLPAPLQRALDRPALLARLRSIREVAIWLTAPSGAGKSTLAAQYALASTAALLWYRCDERDLDPAFFFSTLTRRVETVIHGAESLPRFTDAEHGLEAAFARRFFRALAATGGRLLLVFDDAQEVADQATGEWLAAAVDTCVAPHALLVLSQVPPPVAFYDAVIAQRIAVVSDMDLSFSPAECAQVAAQLRLARADGEKLAQLSGGHAGALVLACELLRGALALPGGERDLGTRVHRHLLGRLMARLSASERAALFAAYPLPQIVPDWIARLSPQPGDAQALGALVRRGLVTEHMQEDRRVYALHALVRQGAREHFMAELGPAAVAAGERAAARLLYEEGHWDDAFALWLGLGDRADALAALERLAEHCARARQATRLGRALQRVPIAEVANRAWLCFWSGLAFLGVDDGNARDWFTRAEAAFDAARDPAGQALALACRLSIFVMFDGDMAGLPAALDAFAALRRRYGLGESLPQRGLYLHGIVCEAYLGDAESIDQPLLLRAVDDLTVLLNDPNVWPHRDLPLAIARTVVEHRYAFDNFALTFHAIRALQTLAGDADTSPLLRARWWHLVGTVYQAAHDLVAAREALAMLRALVETHQLHTMRYPLAELSVQIELRAGNVAAAATALADFERSLSHPTPIELAEVARLGVRVLLLQGRSGEALGRARAARAAAAAAGIDGAASAVFELDFAQALAAGGQFAEAEQRLRLLSPKLGPTQREAIDAHGDCLAFLADPAAPSAAELLARGLSHARKAEHLALLRYVPTLCAQVCAAALMRQIEPEFVRQLIAVQRLVPPPDADECWPWPVKVWTLGGFRLEIDGRPYRPAHKAQDRPLTLLKLLLATTAEGREAADKDRIADLLWPDAAADDARKSLDMAVSRLRRLLGGDDRVEVTEGRLRLAAHLVWSDVRAMIEAVGEIQAARDARARGAAGGTVAAALARLLGAYRGPFLPDGEQPPWLLAARARLAQAVRTALLGELDDDNEQRRLALERALSVDPTAEDLARALMNAHLRAGAPNEALSVFRRCRDALVLRFGTRPSAATEALHERILHTALAGDAVAGLPSGGRPNFRPPSDAIGVIDVNQETTAKNGKPQGAIQTTQR